MGVRTQKFDPQKLIQKLRKSKLCISTKSWYSSRSNLYKSSPLWSISGQTVWQYRQNLESVRLFKCKNRVLKHRFKNYENQNFAFRMGLDNNLERIYSTLHRCGELVVTPCDMKTDSSSAFIHDNCQNYWLDLGSAPQPNDTLNNRENGFRLFVVD